MAIVKIDRLIDSSRMKIAAILDPEYAGEADGAVWIVNSPANEDWFHQHRATLDENSALFFADYSDCPKATVCEMIQGIKDHYPDWLSIFVLGVEATASLVDVLNEEGRCEVRCDRVVVHRY